MTWSRIKSGVATLGLVLGCLAMGGIALALGMAFLYMLGVGD